MTTATNLDDLSRSELVELVNSLRDNDSTALLEQKQQALDTAGEELARQRNRAWNAEQDLSSFKDAVTDALKSRIKGGDIDKDAAFDMAEELGINKPVSTFTVTVQIELTVEGVEADDADDAETQVRNALVVNVNDLAEYETDNWTVDSVAVTED